MPDEKPDENKPQVEEPPKGDDSGDLPPPNRDIAEPEKGPKIMARWTQPHHEVSVGGYIHNPSFVP